MKNILCLILLLSFTLSSCVKNASASNENGTQSVVSKDDKTIVPTGKTVKERFNPPTGYERVSTADNPFGEYLRNLKLKSYGSPVLYFNKKQKPNNGVYVSVVDMEIDSQDLQQCADAVMRLRGEFLYEQKKFDKIHFNIVSDNKPRYFLSYTNGNTSYTKFRAYMRYVFAYANTASLHDELTPVKKIDDIRAGDVFVQKRSPYGHAVAVVDVAINSKTGKKVYLLAQSYMPAQETQILANPANKSISPWYEAKNGAVQTPEWTFTSSDLRRFKE